MSVGKPPVITKEFLRGNLEAMAVRCREKYGYIKFKWWSANMDAFAEEHDEDVMELTYEVWDEWSQEGPHYDKDDPCCYMWPECGEDQPTD